MAAAKPAFHYAISLGANCEAAYQLRRLGLHAQAWPFDQYFSYTEALIAELDAARTGDDFVRRRVQQEHASRPSIAARHHDLQDPAVCAMLARRYERLKKVLRTLGHGVLFVRKNVPYMGNMSDDDGRRLHAALLRQSAPGVDVGLVVINVLVGNYAQDGFEPVLRTLAPRLWTTDFPDHDVAFWGGIDAPWRRLFDTQFAFPELRQCDV